MIKQFSSQINKNSFLSAAIQRYLSAILVYLSSFIVNLIVSDILGPEKLGYWGIFLIIISYYNYSNLGSTNGLTRNLGIAIGKKDKKKIEETIGATHTVQYSLPLLVTFVLIIYGIFISSPYNWIFIFSGIVGFVQIYQLILTRIISSYEKHKKVAIIFAFQSVASIFIIIPLVYYFDLHGRIIAAFVLALTVFFVTYKNMPIKLSFITDKKIIVEIIKVGFPIAFVGFLANNFFLVDRLIIVKFLSMKEFGIYVFAFIVVKVVKNIKQTISNILFQRQNIVFGEDGLNKRERLFFLSKSTAFFITDLTSIISGFILIAFTFIVKYFMPEYNAALPITFVIVFSQVMSSINILITVGKYFQMMTIIFMSLVINIILNILFVDKWGIIGVAYATLISFIIYTILINYFNLKFFNISIKGTLKIISRILLIPLYCFIIAKVIEHYLLLYLSGELMNDLMILGILLFGYSIFIFPLLYILKGHLKLLNKIKLNV